MNSPQERTPGAAIPARLWCHLPPEAASFLRVIVLFRALLGEEKLPEVVQHFHAVAEAWACGETYPHPGNRARQLGSQFIRDYLGVQNPTLLPLLLQDYRHQIEGLDPVEAAVFRLGVLAKDSRTLGWPNQRAAQRRFKALNDADRSKGWKRIDVLSISRFAEAWVRVHHKLEKSLAALVDKQPIRDYILPNAEGPDASTRYRNYWREVRKFDAALKHRFS